MSYKARNDANDAAEDAKAKARTSESRRIAALSESERDKHLDLALLLADEAVETENTFEARNSLFRALLARPGLTSFLHADECYVYSVSFSPDGKTLAAGYRSRVGVDGVVLWDVGGRVRLQDQLLAVAEGDVYSVSFSPDGKTLAAGYRSRVGVDGVVLWDVDLDSWQRHARQIANRNFTPAEWQQFFPERPEDQRTVREPARAARRE